MLVSLSQLQEIPPRSLFLLVGPPGAGKSTFCQQAVIKNLAMDRPIIYVTTEYGPSQAEEMLSERGLSRIEPGLLSYVDAYNETVGVSVRDRPDTVQADCSSLSSIDIAVSKLGERIGRKGILLVFDSLTSPYMFSGSEVLRFITQTLSRFAAQGNAVLACIDEGCGKSEDLVTMMSLSRGVLKMETEDGKRMLNVVKHPKVEATRIEVPGTKIPTKLWDMELWSEDVMEYALQTMRGGAGAVVRSEIGDYVNLFWPNFARWSCAIWDPKHFPEMLYEMSKMHGEGLNEMMSAAPWHQRLLFKRLLPKSLSKVNDMKKFWNVFQRMMEPTRMGFFEYLEDASKTDEHYFRVSESFECWGFESVGAAMASTLPPSLAGGCKGIERWKGLDREWDAVETKCIGLGDPYCEIKAVPGEIDELRASLEAIDSTVLDRMHDRLMDRLSGFLLDGQPLVERPRLGSDVAWNAIMHFIVQPALAGERYRVVMRMAGTKAGKEVGEHLMENGISDNDSVKRVLHFLEHCKVGRIVLEKTIRMKESCESGWTKFTTKREEPSCFFTTGFLNGFFSAIKNQHVKEIRCIAMGDPYCEWEFR